MLLRALRGAISCSPARCIDGCISIGTPVGNAVCFSCPLNETTHVVRKRHYVVVIAGFQCIVSLNNPTYFPSLTHGYAMMFFALCNLHLHWSLDSVQHAASIHCIHKYTAILADIEITASPSSFILSSGIFSLQQQHITDSTITLQHYHRLVAI